MRSTGSNRFATGLSLDTAKTSDNAKFSKSFWWSTKTFGRTDERLVTALYYFSFGFKEGYKRGMDNLKIALNFIRKGRMHIGLPHKNNAPCVNTKRCCKTSG